MAWFKRKLALQQVMRMALGAVLKRDPGSALAEVAISGHLLPQDLDAVATQLLPFDVALWHALFLEHADARTPEAAHALGHKFGAALVSAFVDTQRADEIDRGAPDRVLQTALSYLESVELVADADLEENGIFFYYCQEFTRRVIPGVSLHEAALLRHQQVFDIAKQSYTAARQAFTGLQHQYKILQD